MAKQSAPAEPETYTYVYTGTHVGDVADGRTVEPGGQIVLDGPAIADPHNAALINAGTLLLVETDS